MIVLRDKKMKKVNSILQSLGCSRGDKELRKPLGPHASRGMGRVIPGGGRGGLPEKAVRSGGLDACGGLGHSVGCRRRS